MQSGCARVAPVQRVSQDLRRSNFENWELQLAITLPNFEQVLFYNPVVFSVLASEARL